VIIGTGIELDGVRIDRPVAPPGDRSTTAAPEEQRQQEKDERSTIKSIGHLYPSSPVNVGEINNANR